MPKKVTTNKRVKQVACQRKLPYTPRNHLLTPGERRFFHDGLQPAVGQRYLISCKPRLADLITTKDINSQHGRKIGMKHVDFVLLTPRTTRIVAAIELNDASHLEADRQSRDDFVADALRIAGVPLIGFPIYREYDPAKIRWHIKWVVDRFKAGSG